MKQIIILTIFLTLIVGCSTMYNPTPKPTINVTHILSGTEKLMLNEEDLLQLGLTSDFNEQDLLQLGITDNGTACQTDENYTNIIDLSQGQYSICIYNINGLNNTIQPTESNASP